MAEHPMIPAGQNDSRDPLEAELESFRPASLSAGFGDRIGRELRHDSRRAWRIRSSVGLGLAAAACAAVAFLWWDGRGDGSPGGLQVADTRPADPSNVDTTRPAGELPPPTVAVYHRALASSPAALDALLDAHAPRLFPAADQAPARDAFHSTRSQLSTSNGDTL